MGGAARARGNQTCPEGSSCAEFAGTPVPRSWGPWVCVGDFGKEREHQVVPLTQLEPAGSGVRSFKKNKTKNTYPKGYLLFCVN